jgi:hypothetical protein
MTTNRELVRGALALAVMVVMGGVRGAVAAGAEEFAVGPEAAADQPYRTVMVTTRQRVTTDRTIPATTGLCFTGSGCLEVAKGTTLTLNGSIDAPLQQIFVGEGRVAFGPGRVERVYPQWWGATGDGQADDTAAIQAAIDSIPAGVVYFAPGSYANRGLTAKNALVLQGAQRGASRLTFTPAEGSCIVLPQDCAGFRVGDLTIASAANSSGCGIDGTNEYVRFFSLRNFAISGFKTGVYIQQGLHINLQFGYIGCYGRGEANGTVALKLGDKPLNKSCTTTTLDSVYLTDAEVCFYNRAAPVVMVGPIFETCQIGLDNYSRTILLEPFFAGCQTAAARMTDNGALFIGPFSGEHKVLYAGEAERQRTSFLPSTFDSPMKLGPLDLTTRGELALLGQALTQGRPLQTTLEWDPGPLPGGRSAAKEIPVQGAALGDFVLVAPGCDVQHATVSGTVTGPDTVTVVIANPTDRALTVGPSTWKIRVVK